MNVPARAFPFEAIGHRGFEGKAPGNSINALRLAIDHRIDRVEVDLRRTRDGHVVLFHDATAGGRPVEGLSRDELLAATGLDATTVPCLVDALRLCRGQLAVQLELKSRGIAGQVREELLREGYPLEDVHLSSFDASELGAAREAFGATIAPVQLVYLFGGIPNRFVLRRVARNDIGTISLKARHVTAERVRQLHDRGFRVIAFGIGDHPGRPGHEIERAYLALIDTGVDGFTCARPDIARDIAAKRKPH